MNRRTFLRGLLAPPIAASLPARQLTSGADLEFLPLDSADVVRWRAFDLAPTEYVDLGRVWLGDVVALEQTSAP